MHIHAVISCLSDRKVYETLAKIEEGQLIQALEYFNLSDSMWPTGLHVKHTHGKACDKLANQLMITIKADMMKKAQQDRCHAAVISIGYRLVYSDGCQAIHFANSEPSDGEGEASISNALQSRLIKLAAAESLEIGFSHISSPHQGRFDFFVEV